MNNKRTNKNFGNLKNVKLILIKHIVDEVNSKMTTVKKKKKVNWKVILRKIFRLQKGNIFKSFKVTVKDSWVRLIGFNTHGKDAQFEEILATHFLEIRLSHQYYIR